MHRFLAASIVATAFFSVAAPARAQRDYDRDNSYDSTFTSKHSIAPGGTIRVQDLNGSIDVLASDNAHHDGLGGEEVAARRSRRWFASSSSPAATA